MQDLLKDLNNEQKDAVTHDKGPLLIIAGAGTGKTAVITRRIAHIINTKKARPEEILALTFTDKAALEMEERVDKLVPYGFVDTWISTFHAFGDRFLRENALELGLPSDFRILSRPEQVIFMTERLFEFDLKHYLPLGNPTRHIEALLNVFSKLKDEVISPKEYLDWVENQKNELNSDPVIPANAGILTKTKKDPRVPPEDDNLGNIINDKPSDQRLGTSDELEKHLEVAKAYEKYQNFMMKEGCLDFGDQIALTLKLFQNKKSVLKKYQEQFKYILVDEFQDTNYAQNELLNLLAGKDGNITVVGDDDQSIYRFRGAAISNILDFKEKYPKAKQIVLTKNYRSNQAILDASYKLIKHNDPDRLEVRNNINKKLLSEAKLQKVVPEHLHFDTVSAEADHIAEAIKSRVLSQSLSKKNPNSEELIANSCSYNDIAILVRANSQADPFMKALNAKGIPYKFAGLKGLYSRPEIRLILGFVRAVADPSDSLSLYHLLTSEVYEVPVSDAVVLTSHARRKNRTLSEVILGHSELDSESSLMSSSGLTRGSNNFRKDSRFRENDNFGTGLALSEESLDKISIILEDLEKYREDSKKDTAGQVIYSFLNETGYLKKLVSEINKNEEAEAKIRNIAKFFDKVTEFEYVSIDKSLMNLKKEIDTLIEAGDDPATAEVDPDLDAVNILTVHKSKGLEFKVVFMTSLVNGKFPSRKMSDPINIPEELIKERLPEGDFHFQEERRLFYVGMTRAKEELYFTSAEDYGGKRLTKVSQFVLEALDKPMSGAVKHKLDKIELIKKFAKTETKELTKKFYNEDKILNLNPHQIDDYLSCPLKFKYIHILEIPILRHHPVIYGSAIHKAVQEYFVRKINKYPVTLEDVLEVFENAWVSEGWITREHEEKRLEEGKRSLARFFEEAEKEGRLPSLVESKFSFDLNLNGVRTRINGRYDAVFDSKIKNQKLKPKKEIENSKVQEVSLNETGLNGKRPATSDGFVEIRDFKTSDVKDQKKGDEKAKSNRQLSIYALSYEKINGKIPDEVSLHFVDSGIISPVKKTEKDLEKVTSEIETVVSGIVKDDFEANPGFGECQRCAYSEICPKKK